MPYPMTHMEIAYRLLGVYDWIRQPGDFILGSIAPDAVHFHDVYEIPLKEKSHLWDCGPKWGVTVDSQRWKDSICRFWKQHRNDENRDFAAGYCLHLLTDWLNDRRMWSPFREQILQGADYDRIYGDSQYRREAHGYDQWLYQNSPHTEKVWELLESGRAQGLEGLIWARDLERQKKSVLTEQFAQKEKRDIAGYVYFGRERIEEFMRECVGMAEAVVTVWPQ